MENTHCKHSGNRMHTHATASSRGCQHVRREGCTCQKTGCEDCNFQELNRNNCACESIDFDNCRFISVPTTAVVYIAMQEFKDLYDTCVGFNRGTIFAELDKPWLAGGCRYGK